VGQTQWHPFDLSPSDTHTGLDLSKPWHKSALQLHSHFEALVAVVIVLLVSALTSMPCAPQLSVAEQTALQDSSGSRIVMKASVGGGHKHPQVPPSVWSIPVLPSGHINAVAS
jgi:hypothetical protein|tara:strand:+ start:162 stop:500 length:339 start_codon:yes stop_codon:yes gene_type:complete